MSRDGREHPSDNNLEALLAAARGGNAAAQAGLFYALAGRLRPIVNYRLRTYRPEDRDDLLQDTLATFFEKISAVQDHPERFALQILRNKIGNWIQSPWRGKVDAIRSDEADDALPQSGISEARLSLGQENADIHEEIDRAARLQKIIRAIRELADFCRLVLTGLMEGYTVAEIWDRVQELEQGLARGAFDKRIFDCKKKLRERLRGVLP